MPRRFNSLIFGLTREATDEELSQIKLLVQNCPVTVFQILNKRFNERDLMIGVCSRDDDLLGEVRR